MKKDNWIVLFERYRPIFIQVYYIARDTKSKRI